MVSGLEKDVRVLTGCECPVVLPVTPVTVVAGSGGLCPALSCALRDMKPLDHHLRAVLAQWLMAL